MVKDPFLSSFLPGDYLAPFRWQIYLGIVGMTLAQVYHPLVGILLLGVYVLIESTTLKKYFRKPSTGILILFTAIYLLYTSVLLLVLFTLYFQVLYLWSAKKPAHLFWITAVGFVHLAIVSTITASVVFPAIFLAYVITITQSLLVANLLAGVYQEDGSLDTREIRRITPGFFRKMKIMGGWISGISLGIAVLFFPFLPRFQRLSYQPTQFTQASVTGFTDEVALGEIGEIQSDSRVAMRIFVPAEIGTRIYRWRGAVLEDWNHSKQTWNSGTQRRTRGAELQDWISFYNFPVEVSDAEIQVNVSSMPSPMIFLPETADGPPIEAARVAGPFERVEFDPSSWTCTPGGEFVFRSYEYRLKMLAQRLPDTFEELDPDTRARCLDLSTIQDEDFLEKLRARGEEILTSSGPRPYDAYRLAMKLSGGVQMGQSYTLDYTQEESARDLSDFIFNFKSGHCEYFATTLTLLLRVYDIPARVVTGFRPGRTNFFDSYQIIRQSDAHSWVEAFIQGEGWKTLDPTPAAPQVINPWAQNMAFLSDIYDFMQLQWNRYILDFSNEDQKEIFTSFSRSLGIFLAPLFFGVEVLALMRKVLAGILFCLFLLWLVREVAPELGTAFQSLTLRLPGLSWFGQRSQDYHPATRIFRRVEKEWGRKGVKRKAGETPRQYLARIGEKLPDAASLCEEFTNLYYPRRFGRSASDTHGLRELREAGIRLLRLSLEVKS